MSHLLASLQKRGYSEWMEGRGHVNSAAKFWKAVQTTFFISREYLMCRTRVTYEERDEGIKTQKSNVKVYS